MGSSHARTGGAAARRATHGAASGSRSAGRSDGIATATGSGSVAGASGAFGSASDWPFGGRAVTKPKALDADWTYGTTADAAVRESVDASKARPDRGRGSALVIGCGALARELVAVTERIPGLDVACLAPDLHNRPDGIPAAVRDRIRRARADGYERIFVAYADCGTGGLLEPVLAEAGVERLPGAHCYEVFAGGADFARMADAEPGTFWLTDFLARNFERLVIRGLGIDRHPDLLDVYFANYRRVVYLSQTDDSALLALARDAAERLGLAFEHRPTGIAGLEAPIAAFAAAGVPGVARRARDSRGTGVSNTRAPSVPRNPPESAAASRRARTSDPNGPDRVRYARGARIAMRSTGAKVATAATAATAATIVTGATAATVAKGATIAAGPATLATEGRS